MVIRLEVLPWLSELVDGSISRKVVLQEDVPDRMTLRAVLVLLQDRYPRLGSMVFDANRRQLTGHSEIAVNGVLYDRAGGLDSPLKQGDTISFLPGIAGGSRAVK